MGTPPDFPLFIQTDKGELLFCLLFFFLDDESLPDGINRSIFSFVSLSQFRREAKK